MQVNQLDLNYNLYWFTKSSKENMQAFYILKLVSVYIYTHPKDD